MKQQSEIPTTMNRNAEHRLGAGKAALKPPALQTLARGTDRPGWREAFGVRAALAPLSLSRAAKPRLRGSKREILFPRNLTPALSPSEGERENHRQPVSESDGVGNIVGCTLLFPLPRRGGEGQGEGLC